jgi:DNA polymerase-3 subunit alpha
LFDIVSEEQKEEFDIKLPDVGEYSKEMKLAFEKEVLGIYVSGHPLEEYESLWRKHIRNTTTDFMLDDETQAMRAVDGVKTTIGGLITEKKIKYTKNEQVMAFLNLEDLVGNIEVIVFPRDYEKNSAKITEENKVFIKGRVSVEEDKDAKLICESIVGFDEVPRKLWIKFKTKEDFLKANDELMSILRASDGKDTVVLYIEATKERKILPQNMTVLAQNELLEVLCAKFGKENVKVTV